MENVSPGRMWNLGIVCQHLTADDNYSRYSREDSQQPIQMQLSKKQKTLRQFFTAFPNFTKNFEHFDKKISLIAEKSMKLLSLKDL